MIAWHPPEVPLTFGGLEIRTYGALLGLAILLGLVWAQKRARRSGVDPKLAEDVFFWAIVGGVVGARLGFVIQDLPGYFAHPGDIVQVWLGGLSFHGALVGGLAAGWLVLRQRHALDKFWVLADVAAAPLLLGAIIGRLGNWANQELYGYPSNLPWAITIDPTHRLPGYESFAGFHPTFAYEAVLNLVGLFLLVFFVEKIRNQKSEIKMTNQNAKLAYGLWLTTYGSSFLFVLMWYAIARGITEIWRISDRIIANFSFAQLISLGILVLIGLTVMRRRNRPIAQR